MSEEPLQGDPVVAVEAAVEPVLPAMSQSMPFMARPVALDGSLAGDVGFDPLGFARTKDDLMNYREAEVKHAVSCVQQIFLAILHCNSILTMLHRRSVHNINKKQRLAMLAAAGWPVSELFDKKIAAVMGMEPLLQSADRAPSVLNGGLGNVSPIYWGVCLVAAAAIDLYGIFGASKKVGYTPGDFGFDPLGVFPKDKEGQEWFKLAEIKNGRLAMIAITAFAVQVRTYLIP
jgi:hypothetical protein